MKLRKMLGVVVLGLRTLDFMLDWAVYDLSVTTERFQYTPSHIIAALPFFNMVPKS